MERLKAVHHLQVTNTVGVFLDECVIFRDSKVVHLFSIVILILFGLGLIFDLWRKLVDMWCILCSFVRV